MDRDVMKKLSSLKEKVEEGINNRNKLQGRLDSEMEKLNEKGYKTLEEADAFVEKSMEELEKKKKEFNFKLKSFEEEYADYL